MKYPDNLDSKSEVFLRAVHDLGGEASTTEIYDSTGISKTSRDYRFDKLEQMGLIEITKADTGYGDRHPPKIAKLTPEGISEVEKTHISDEAHDIYFSHKEDEVLESVIDDLERIEAQIKPIKIRLETLENWRESLSEVFRDPLH